MSVPAPEVVEPIYFGREGRPLFGCLHTDRGAGHCGSGVVLCQPVGQEYIRCHRSLRQLAARLAAAGQPALRFDYYGSGDSAGEGEQATLGRWVSDVHEAVRFMRGRCRVNRVALVGLRLGAAIAMCSAAEHEMVERLVLWDPTVRGEDYLRAMREQSAQFETWMEGLFGPRPAGVTPDGPRDLLGFRFARRMLDEIAALDLMAVTRPPSRQALVLANGADASAGALRDHLARLGVEVELDSVSAPKIWLSEPHQGIVPHESLERLTRWLSGP